MKVRDLFKSTHAASLVNEMAALENEFNKLAESKTGKLRKSTVQSISNLEKYDTLDNNNQPYLAYRFGLALAGAPDTKTPKTGPLGSSFITIDYSEADTAIRRAAEKQFGIKADSSTGSGSKELKNVNRTSPVAKPKRNKYGV